MRANHTSGFQHVTLAAADADAHAPPPRPHRAPRSNASAHRPQGDKSAITAGRFDHESGRTAGSSSHAFRDGRSRPNSRHQSYSMRNASNSLPRYSAEELIDSSRGSTVQSSSLLREDSRPATEATDATAGASAVSSAVRPAQW